MDTSEMSSDGAAHTTAASKKEGSGSQNSVESGHKTEHDDNYFKIKMHAMSCLGTLFK